MKPPKLLLYPTYQQPKRTTPDTEWVSDVGGWCRNTGNLLKLFYLVIARCVVYNWLRSYRRGFIFGGYFALQHVTLNV